MSWNSATRVTIGGGLQRWKNHRVLNQMLVVEADVGLDVDDDSALFAARQSTTCFPATFRKQQRLVMQAARDDSSGGTELMFKRSAACVATGLGAWYRSLAAIR